MTNALYYGDNLAVLRESVPTESIDLAVGGAGRRPRLRWRRSSRRD
jgi:hypothetical protein